MLQSLTTNIFSAANEAAPPPSAEIFPGLESGLWATSAPETTSSMEAEDDNNYTYILHTATTTTPAGQHLVACSGSNNLIRIYDASRPRGSSGGQLPLLATLNHGKPAGNSPVTDIAFVAGGALLSCSESGRLFLWDVRAPGAPVGKMACPPTGSMTTSCVCARNDGKVVAAGVGSGIRLWDVGTRKVVAGYEEAHTDDVTVMRFHPVAGMQLISGSLDGLICITDTSVPPTPEGDEDEGDTLVSVLSVEHPINYFDFTDQEAKSVGVITCDEEFSIWSLESCSILKAYPETRTRLTTPTYAAEHLVGCHYDPSIGPVLVSTNTTGAFALHSAAQDLQTIAQAAGSHAAGHIGQVRSYAMAGSVLVTGGEDSRVCTWGPKGQAAQPQQPQPQQLGGAPAEAAAAAAAAAAGQMGEGMVVSGAMRSSGAIRHDKKYKKINKRPYEK